MNKQSFAAVSLVAALPAWVLVVLLVMSFLGHVSSLGGALMVINGLALLVSACVGLAPVGIFLFMPETEADAATKKKAEKKSDDGEDEESEDEAEGAEIDDFDADDETEGAFAAVDSPDSEAESDFDISDTGYDTMTAPPTEPDLFVEGDDADFEDFGTEEIDKDA